MKETEDSGEGHGTTVETISVPPPPAKMPDRASLKDIVSGQRQSSDETPHPPMRSIASVAQLAHRTRLKKTMFVETVVYTVFLAVFTIFLFSSRADIYAFFFSDLMKDLLLREEFPAKDSHIQKTYYDIGDMDEFWQWLQGPLVSALYNNELYDGVALPTSRQDNRFIFGVHRKVGTVRLRQMRVAAGSCLVPDAFAAAIGTCYGHYSSSTESTSSFVRTTTRKVGNTTTTVSTTYDYSSATSLNETFTYMGRIASYSGGGFVVDFPIDRNATVELLERLKDERWIDIATRAVMVDFTIYNPSINLFLVARVLTEFPATGGAIPTQTFRVVKIFRYVTDEDTFIMAIEIILVVFVVYYIVEEVTEAFQKGKRYFRDFWNYLDMLNLIFFVVVILFRVIQLFSGLEVDATAQTYYNFQYIGYLIDQERNLNAVNAFLCYFKIFKYLQVSPRMSQLSQTLSTAGWDLISFLMMFFIVFFGYALSGHVLFGRDILEFHTITSSLFALFIAVLGDFDFYEIQDANRYLGPAFFLSFQVLVFFILMNMFIAIIVDSYGKVKENATNKPMEMRLNIGEAMRRQMRRVRWALMGRLRRVEETEDAVAMADTDGDDKITRQELEVALEKAKDRSPSRGAGASGQRQSPSASAMADELLAEFDADGDQILDADERKKLEAKLAREKDQLIKMTDDVELMEASAAASSAATYEELKQARLTGGHPHPSAGRPSRDLETGGRTSISNTLRRRGASARARKAPATAPPPTVAPPPVSQHRLGELKRQKSTDERERDL